jgi:hypothetical protein
MANKAYILSPVTELEIREAFHCALLSHLPSDYRAPAAGSAPLRLKGGVNLRLFHQSPRYSEDIDFDLSPSRGPKFSEHLRKVLSNPGPFKVHLLKLGIQTLELSDLDGGAGGFKQKLRILSGGVPHHTKVEVSYAEETKPAEAIVVRIPESFRHRYLLPADTFVAAYPAPTAIWQKALAISRRASPQTRDVFDIHHLHQTAGAAAMAEGLQLVGSRMDPEQIAAARDAVLAFTTDQFKDQTVTYLPEETRDDAIARWPDIQHQVWEWLANLLDESSIEQSPVTDRTDAEV